MIELDKNFLRGSFQTFDYVVNKAERKWLLISTKHGDLKTHTPQCHTLPFFFVGYKMLIRLLQSSNYQT